MAELESAIEQKLIEQLVYGDSQWTYRGDLKTEADLWKISGIFWNRTIRTGWMEKHFLMLSLNR